MGRRLILLLATGCGLGWAPVAPGTFGSLAGLLWAWGVQELPGPAWIGWLAAATAILLSVPICQQASVSLGDKDPGAVVLDEIVALPLVFGCGLLRLTPTLLVLGFVAFRVLDILKPPPARQLERLSGGWGIVADDLIAAAYAGLVVWGGSTLTSELTGT